MGFASRDSVHAMSCVGNSYELLGRQDVVRRIFQGTVQGGDGQGGVQGNIMELDDKESLAVTGAPSKMVSPP